MTKARKKSTITEDSWYRLMAPGEVAALFKVHRRTVSRWAADGKLPGLRSPGGHWRFREFDVRALLDDWPLDGGAS